MTNEQIETQRSQSPRKPRLSPDVAEFLNILNAIEARNTSLKLN